MIPVMVTNGSFHSAVQIATDLHTFRANHPLGRSTTPLGR